MTRAGEVPAATSGHHTLPHTADLTIEAWAPTREDCFTEALKGLTGAFAEVMVQEPPTTVPIDLAPVGDEELLVALLEEVIYLAEVPGVVAVNARFEPVEAGGLRGCIETVPIDRVELIGSAPKGVSRHGLRFARAGDEWRCRATIDV